MLVTVVSLALLAATIAPLVANGFRHSQREVTRRSTAGLEAQGSDALLRLVEREVAITGAQLQLGMTTSQQAADYLAATILQGTTPDVAPQLVQGGEGQYFDPNPARQSDLFVPRGTNLDDPGLRRDLRVSAALDPLFPTLLSHYLDAVSIAYLAPSGLVRAYPITNYARIVPPDFSAFSDASFTAAAPPANPARVTVWRAPFSDPAGQGLLVTASTPVYVGNEFHGVVAVNISLRNLIDHLYTQKPTLHGYAFLSDADGRLIAAPPAALPALVGTGQGDSPTLRETLGLPLVGNDPAFARSVEAMRRGQQGIDRVVLDDEAALLAYAPLNAIGWRLGLVAPIGELTEQSATISRAIAADADTTLNSTLALMAVTFLLTLIVLAIAGHRLLTRPIAALAAGTRTVAAGSLDVTIPVRRDDELGDLAASFNRMIAELRAARDGLERRTAELLGANAALEAEVGERRRAEEALQEREAQYRGIFEETSDGIVISEPEGGIVEVNPAMCRMHGSEREELLGRRPASLVRGDYTHLSPVFSDELRERGQYTASSILARKDGGALHVEIRAATFLYRGRPHVLSVVHDISERVEAYELLEARVAERTRELTAVLRIAHDVASTLELAPLLGVILDQLGTVVSYSAAAISTVEGADLVGVEYRGAVPSEAVLPRRLSLQLAESLWAEVNRREAIVIDDVRGASGAAEEYRRIIGEEVAAAADVRSWLGVPLLTLDRPIGLLVLTSPQPHAYGEADLRMVTAIAAQAAVAIENARLYEQARGIAALEERQKLARELHDSVSQALYGIALGARTARTLLDRDPTRLAGPLDYILQLAEAGLTEMRALIFELRPESLENEGLVVALEKQGASLQARHHLAVTLDLGAEPQMPLDAKEALYRIAQESLHNITKHAHAKAVDVKLHGDGETVTLEIRDDGVGFDPGGSFPGHLGLRSMRERAARLGGTLEITSAPGAGTHLVSRIPVRARAAVAPAAR
jgi:PAS domain S-box-containing protein